MILQVVYTTSHYIIQTFFRFLNHHPVRGTVKSLPSNSPLPVRRGKRPGVRSAPGKNGAMEGFDGKRRRMFHIACLYINIYNITTVSIYIYYNDDI